MKRKVIIWMLCVLAVVGMIFAVPALAAGEDQTTTTVTTADELVAAVDAGYTYVQLGADIEAVLTGQTLVVDLAGYDLTVSGSGKVNAFDSANDTYDHTLCGTLSYGNGITCDTDYVAPNGNRYIAVGSSGGYTFHRLEMKITSVALRTSCAGMYYKSTFACDRLVQESVQSYGVAVSLDSIPGKNFATAENVLYTAMPGSGLVSDAVVNSGIIANILSADADKVADNGDRGQMEVNARLYININGVNYLGTTYAKNSLKGLMDKLDGAYSGLTKAVRGQLDEFHGKWKAYSTGWTFTNIGNNELDLDTINAPLSLDADNQAYCPVCKETKTWTLITSDARVSAVDGGHYYLDGDVEYTETGSALSYFSAPGTGGYKACLHLNEHNITATNVKAIFGSSGVLNVMGNGIVTGYSSVSDEGAAIHTNNKNKANGINLYGGTYRKTDDSVSGAGVIATGKSGRIYTIYEDVTIDGGTGVAIYIDGETTYYGSIIELIGCTVNGKINQKTHTGEPTTLDIIDATINGTVNVNTNQNVTLSGKLSIDTLVVPDGYKVTTNSLEEGTSIGLNAIGYFTAANANLGDYIGYFTPTNANYGVIVRNNALYCGKDYVSDLVFAEGTTDAYCPVCEKTVTWTALTQDYVDTNVSTTASTGYALPADSHFYLTENITTASANQYALLGAPSTVDTSCCIHLNGNNLTATATTVFYSANGILNVMGNGTVAGTAHGSYGAVAHSNSRNVDSSMNFYAGNYTNTADSGYVFRAGGAGARFYFYDDVVIEQNGSSGAIYTNALTGRDSVVSLTGTKVNGGITFNGIKAGNEYSGAYTITLNGATVNGTLTAAGSNNISLINDVKISLLDVSEDSKVNLTDGSTDGETIGSGSFITVKNAGAFALEFEGAADFVNCFRTAWRDDKIICRDNVLTYKSNYKMGLQWDGASVARCPVCQKNVTWTAVTDETASVSLAGGHYYLSKDLTFDAASDAGAYLVANGTDAVTCLHLNGHIITSKQEPALAVGTGKINVMGEGTVVGNTDITNNGSAIVANNSTDTNGAYIYSGTYKKYDSTSEQPVISILENGGNITVYEDAVVDAEGGVAVYTGTAAEGTSNLTLDNVSIDGDVAIAGASEQAVFNTYHTTINGDVTVSGTNDITFSGKTDITGQLVVAEGSYVGFADMLPPDSNIVVNATGTFTTSLDEARAWANYFTSVDTANNWVLARDNALYHGERVSLEATAVASDSDAEALLNAYADLSAKYGEMHNHTSAGLAADGRNTLAEWKARMIELGMDFATIVDHHQVAHMYHDDWQEAPTEESPVVFVGGSEPASTLSGLSASATQTTLHYNMITGNVDKLISILSDSRFSKFNYSNSKAYGDNDALLNWSYQDKLYNGVVNNRYKGYVATEYSKDTDGFYDYYNYAKWTKTEFETLVAAFYETGGLLVEVHPDYPSYIQSTDFMDYCFSGDAGTDEAAAMGFEIHTANYGYTPSQKYNESAYQLWLDMLDAGKKVYATYGDDSHKLPTAMALTTIYAHDGATASDYMAKMNAGNFAPGWVGIRMMIGDEQMGGTADTFEGQRLVFSIGDMYEANDFSRIYRDKSNKEQTLTWEPGYDATYTYTVRLYDDGGLLMESEVNPSEMNYYAIDADATAKYYRIEVWAENADGSIRYRCGVGNPIWNAAAYATAE